MSILSSNMREIIVFLREHEQATLSQIIEGTGLHYYNNTRKYVGETLGRMVKNGTIRRVKKGLYAFRKELANKPAKQPTPGPGQLSLFNS